MKTNLDLRTDSNYFWTIDYNEEIPEDCNEKIAELSKLNRSKSFDSENLKVDYITFNFKRIRTVKKKEICKYLLTLGFNCFYFNSYYQPLHIKSKNEYRVNLANYSWFRRGIQLRFSGENAEYLYSLIKRGIINWEIFAGGKLARFDLYYDRIDQSSDDIEPIEFLHRVSELIQKKYKKKHRCILKFGSILNINNRRNARFIRIYRKKKLTSLCLRFEYELKKEALKTSHSLLFSNKLDEFENELSTNFILYLANLIPLQYCYAEWLAVKRRSLDILKTKKVKKNSKVLGTHYLKTDKFKDVAEQKKFILFLQFIAFARTLNYSTEKFGFQMGIPVTYRFISFKVNDFYLFQNPTKKTIDYYQVDHLKDFLNNLKEFSIASVIESWTDDAFRILTYIPMAEVSKDPLNHNCVMAKVYLAQDLFSYTYPQILPDFFTNEKRCKNDAIRVGFKFLQTISSEAVQKKFLIKDFLAPYKNKISPTRISKMKKDFIKLAEQFQEQGFLENKYEVLTEYGSYPVAKLESEKISYGFVVYEKL